MCINYALCVLASEYEAMIYPLYFDTYSMNGIENVVQSGSNMLLITKTSECGDGVYSYEQCDLVLKFGEVENKEYYDLRAFPFRYKGGKFSYVGFYPKKDVLKYCIVQNYGHNEELEKIIEKKIHDNFDVFKVDAYCFEGTVPEYKRCPSTAPYFNSATNECTNICDSIPNYQSRIRCYCKEKGLKLPDKVEASVKFDENGNYEEGCLLTCEGDFKNPLRLDYTQCTTDDNLNADDKNDYGVKPGENDGNSDGKTNDNNDEPKDNNAKPNNPDNSSPNGDSNSNNNTNSNNSNDKKDNASNENSNNNNGDNNHNFPIPDNKTDETTSGNNSNSEKENNSDNEKDKPEKGKNDSKIIPSNNLEDNGECKGLECGKPDKLPGEDIKQGTEKMFSSFENFKNNLLDKTDSLKNDLNDLKNRIITNKFQNLTNYEITRCPYKTTFATPYFSIPLNFDVCVVVSILHPVIYFLTFISVLYLGIKFFLKILMRL